MPASSSLVLLVPTDGSPRADGALPVALGLAEHRGGEVHLAHALPSNGVGADPAHAPQVRERLDATCLMYRYLLPGRAPVSLRPVVLPPGPSASLLAYARHAQASIIVMASHGLAAPGPTWPAVTDEIVREAPCAVLVLPPAATHPLRTLAVPAGHGAEGEAVRRMLGLAVARPPCPPADATCLWLADTPDEARDRLADGHPVLYVPAALRQAA